MWIMKKKENERFSLHLLVSINRSTVGRGEIGDWQMGKRIEGQLVKVICVICLGYKRDSQTIYCRQFHLKL